jgi:asparagine synthase (glutamine-hydrolysing)
MIAALAHRGPDGSGVFVGDSVGFGHTRLSIVGLADGQQPMATADGRTWISFNGEIFNYVELREKLITQSCRFRTTSDTEVILSLYDRMGLDFVAHLNGDFAFAIWDERRRRLILARDRMGVRPLFYTKRAGTLYFASEVKALLEVPGIAAELDPFALDQIFTFWAPIAPRTPFKNIFQLPPASIMVVDQDSTTVKPYWRLNFPDRNEELGQHLHAKLIEELRALLSDATRIRLRADVPVGAYLSGGLDSSIVTALAAQQVPKQLRTFSVTFESKEHDESAHQDEVARALGTRHLAITCHDGDIANIFPDVVSHMESPVLRTAPAPLYLLSQLVRDQGFKVVLTGEGADEIFAGYDIFKEAAIRRFCARQPGSRIRPHLFRKLYHYLPSLKQQSPDYLAAFFGTRLDGSDPLFSHQPRLRGTTAAKMFYSGDLRAVLKSFDAAAELIDQLPPEYCRWHPLHQAQYIETSLLLPGYILSSQGDRVAMAHSIEGRFPFLDHRLVEFAARVPPRLKLNGLTEKYILREAMKDLLPSSISSRTKQPYRAPDSQSFTAAGAPDYVSETLAAREVEKTGLFNAQAVGKLYAKCCRQESVGFRDNSALIGILSTQLWHRIFATRPSVYKSQTT